MAIAIGDRVSVAAGGPPLTVVRILDDGTLECLAQIGDTGASGEITRHAQDAVLRLDKPALPDSDRSLRAETEPSGANLPDGRSPAPGRDTGSIAARAYALWEAAGRPDGQHDAHWFQAERELAASHPDIEPAIVAGAFQSAAGRMTPAEAYDENPKGSPQGRAGPPDPDVHDEP